MAGTPVAMAYDAQRKRQNTIIAIIAVVGCIIAAILGLGAAGILKLGGKAPANETLAAKGSAPAPALQATGQAPPPSLEKVAQAPIGMPDDVRAWLEHLRKCEEAKNEISIKQTAEMIAFLPKLQALGAGIGQMNPYDMSEGPEGESPEAVTKGKFLNLKPQWEELLTYFHSYPPPAECKPLADDFSRALGEIPGATADIVEVLNGVSADPSSALESLGRMKKGSYGEIDRYFQRADVRLTDICRKYNTNKWFNIRADVDAGMFGKIGL